MRLVQHMAFFLFYHINIENNRLLLLGNLMTDSSSFQVVALAKVFIVSYIKLLEGDCDFLARLHGDATFLNVFDIFKEYKIIWRLSEQCED